MLSLRVWRWVLVGVAEGGHRRDELLPVEVNRWRHAPVGPSCVLAWVGAVQIAEVVLGHFFLWLMMLVSSQNNEIIREQQVNSLSVNRLFVTIFNALHHSLQAVGEEDV